MEDRRWSSKTKGRNRCRRARRQSDPYGHAAPCRRHSRAGRIDLFAPPEMRATVGWPSEGPGLNDATASPRFTSWKLSIPFLIAADLFAIWVWAAQAAPHLSGLAWAGRICRRSPHRTVSLVGPPGRTGPGPRQASYPSSGSASCSSPECSCLPWSSSSRFHSQRGGLTARHGVDCPRRSAGQAHAAIRFRVRTALVGDRDPRPVPELGSPRVADLAFAHLVLESVRSRSASENPANLHDCKSCDLCSTI